MATAPHLFFPLMHPVLLKLPYLGFDLRAFGVFVAAGCLAAILFATSEARRRGEDPDQIRDLCFFTLIAGLRQTHFQGEFTENETDPRFGVALRIPKLNWVFRGFYGRFYQPPPLLTFGCSSASIADGTCNLQNFALSTGTSFAPLHGERDEEHQFGVQIPYRGWLLDADTFKTRVNNFLDHSNLGNSSIYFPVTVDGALIRAWEVSLRSPRLWHFGQAHLAYSNQIAEQRGAITGGLICAPIGDPACDAGFDYTPVDHDQRNTLNVGFNATDTLYNKTVNLGFSLGFDDGPMKPLKVGAGVVVTDGKATGGTLDASLKTGAGDFGVKLQDTNKEVSGMATWTIHLP